MPALNDARRLVRALPAFGTLAFRWRGLRCGPDQSNLLNVRSEAVPAPAYAAIPSRMADHSWVIIRSAFEKARGFPSVSGRRGKAGLPPQPGFPECHQLM